MKKIVSLALFGEGYSHFLPSYVRAHLNIFPQAEDWTLRVHVDNIVAGNAWGRMLNKMVDAGLIEVVLMGTAPLSKASLWRMAPVFETNDDFVFCRDIDAIPMPRDRACCDEFMASGAIVHTIHDHLHHVNIMAGLCGFKVRDFRSATQLYSLEDIYTVAQRTDEQWLDKETDQHVLNRLLLAPGGPELFEHRYNGWFNGPDEIEARGPGAYPCPRYTSAPVPNKGSCWTMPGGETQPLSRYTSRADRLGPHLGCAGYDWDAAKKFWDEIGDPRIADKIKECES